MLFEAPQNKWRLQRNSIKGADGDAMGILVSIQAGNDCDPSCKGRKAFAELLGGKWGHLVSLLSVLLYCGWSRRIGRDSCSWNRGQDFILFSFNAFKAIFLASLRKEACALVEIVLTSRISKVHHVLRCCAGGNEAHIAHRHVNLAR